jgi:hypothetical protein
MKLFELITEEASGHKRLVKSIINMAIKMYGKAPTKFSVEHKLKMLEKDTSFYDRIINKAKKLGGNADGYYWQSIRKRVASSFAPKNK